MSERQRTTPSTGAYATLYLCTFLLDSFRLPSISVGHLFVVQVGKHFSNDSDSSAVAFLLSLDFTELDLFEAESRIFLILRMAGPARSVPLA